MCGIVSLISRRTGGFFHSDLEIFRNLLVLDTLRGLDSTGVFSVSGNRQVELLKVASHPYHLFACDAWDEWQRKAIGTGRIIVGHNRKATKGSINSKNAHPFHEDNIVLVHNGSLRDDHKKMKDVEVDSHALCHAFNENGAENVIPTINGAFALVWWDITKNRLFAVRNDERPLSLVVTDDLYVMCSEPWMALQLLAREKRKVTEVIDILPGVLYEFQLNGSYTTSKQPIKEWSYEVVQHHTGRVRHGMYVHGDDDTSSVSDPKMITNTSSSSGSGPSGTASTPNGSGTSLTLVKGGDSTTTSRSEKPPIDPDAGHVPCVDFPKGSPVLVKYYEMKPAADDRPFYLARGKVIEPGQAEIDVVSFIPKAFVRGDDVPKYMTEKVIAHVVKHTQSVCGRSLYVNDNQFSPEVKVHNANISEVEWRYVITHGKCKHCEAVIYDEEREFTSVTRKPNNKLSVTCADCIEDKLPGDLKHEFNQNRLAALQAYEQQRNSAGGSTQSGSTTQTSGTPTIH